MGPLVSFVVPCYRLAHLLHECISSILCQSYREFEILVLDNCSPDNTREVVSSLNDHRIRYFRNESNLGHLRNFNKGIAMSRGKYVWLVSADDFLASRHALARYVDVMERNSRLGYVFCRAREARAAIGIGEVLGFTDLGTKDRIWNGLEFLKSLIQWNCVVMSSVMVRKECYDKVTFFPLDLPYACDWYLWCSFAIYYDVAYLAEPMVCWRIHDESLTKRFMHEEAPICLTDEINVLQRIACQAELAGVPSLRDSCNTSIISHAVRALKPYLAGNSRRELSELEKIVRCNITCSQDEEAIRAHVYAALGDDRYWNDDRIQAMRLYSLSLRLRPWWFKSSAKYLLSLIGSPGVSVRRLLSPTAATTRAGLGRCKGSTR
jgi:glycosyltransferase involved in cell wall biosynthesis